MNHASEPLLIILSGLPGTGKTSVGRELARQIGAVHLRVDTIEQALRDAERAPVEEDERGYRIAGAIAEDNLRLGNTVVADSANLWTISRQGWREVAKRIPAPFLDVELVCSDLEEHRRRVETRVSDVPGLKLPTWEAIQSRETDDWDADHLVIDTGSLSVEQSAARIRAAVGR